MLRLIDVKPVVGDSNDPQKDQRNEK
jgi:hypothetical protein